MGLIACPECGGPAEIQWRTVENGTHGPVAHAKDQLRATALVPATRCRTGDRTTTKGTTHEREFTYYLS